MQDGEGSEIWIIASLDFCFVGSLDKEENAAPILALFDNHLGASWALGVETKELSKVTVDYCVRRLELAGYRGEKVTLKSDEEASIMAPKNAAARARVGHTHTPLIDSPVRESKANGAVERAVRTWQGQHRTLKHYFEHKSGLAKLGKTIPVERPLSSWRVIWVCEMLLKCSNKGADSLTQYDAMTGHTYTHPFIEFGEVALFRGAMNKDSRHNADEYWHEGIFLGVETRTSEFIITTG